jgi:putative transposase
MARERDAFGCELRESGWESGHLRQLVGYLPKVAILLLVNMLKGVSARRVRAANLPELPPSYCAVSCGGAPLKTVKRYSQQQRGGLLPALKDGVSVPVIR